MLSIIPWSRILFTAWYVMVYSFRLDVELTSGAFLQAQFLPWHRHFGYLYEASVRECGYGGFFPNIGDTLSGRPS